jgi:hypothetical protein
MTTKHVHTTEPFDVHGSDLELHLRAGAVVSVDGHGGVEIESRRGTLWVTASDDATDYVVREGRRVAARQPGRIVVQALSDADVHVNLAA